MRIFVVNLRKNSFWHSFIAVAVIFSILLTLSLAALGELYGGDLFITASAEAKSKTIILDAGHGGEDSGAIGVSGELEKDLNLEITLALGELLKERGFTVIYTRTEDKLLYLPEQDIRGIRKISDLKNRCKVAEANPDAIFVSIHMNSFGSSKYSGLQVYYSTRNEESYQLASKIQNSVRTELQPSNNRVIKTGEGIYLLEHIDAPAVLIECGFLTNSEECEKLSQKEYQKELCFAIICGIIEYIEAN